MRKWMLTKIRGKVFLKQHISLGQTCAFQENEYKNDLHEFTYLARCCSFRINLPAIYYMRYVIQCPVDHFNVAVCYKSKPSRSVTVTCRIYTINKKQYTIFVRHSGDYFTVIDVPMTNCTAALCCEI